MIWAFNKISPVVNALLRPFGLIVWVLFDCEEDDKGLPTNLRVVGVRLGRRPWR